MALLLLDRLAKEVSTIKAKDVLTANDVYEIVSQINVELTQVENLSAEHYVYMSATGNYLCIEFVSITLWESEDGFVDIEYEEDEEFYVVLKRSLVQLLENFHLLYTGLKGEGNGNK